MTLATVQARYHALEGRRDLLAQQISATEKALAESAEEVEACDTALAQLHTVRDTTTARMQGTVAELVTDGLRMVFEDPDLRLEVRSVERRGVVEADLILVRGGLETSPLDGNGGGLVADAAAVMRLVLVRLLSLRGIMPLLVLDEPFAALSEDRREAMAQVLYEIAHELGIQVLTVTHADEFALGSVYRVRWADHARMRAEVVEAARREEPARE